MPAIPFNSGIDLQKTGRIAQGGWETLPNAPTNPVAGQQYFDSTLKKVGFWNGTKWIYGVDFAQGTGIIIANDTISVDTRVIAELSDLPTVNDATLTIQKNGVNVATFTANSNTNQTANITVPTTASDVGALPDTTTINDLTSTAQQQALNSGINSTLVGQISTNQTNINTINSKIPSAASSTNPLADREFVNSSISTNTADFDGSWNTYADIPTTVAGFTNAGYPTPTNNNYLVVKEDETQDGGTWRYKYVDDGTAYDKNKWKAEYEVNESPFTQAQLNAINSGANTTNIAQIGTNTTNIGTLQTQIATKSDAFAITNPALSVSGGVCTWTFNNTIGTKNVQVQIWREVDGVRIETYIKVTTSQITVSFNSTANITAGAYRAVVVGLK